MKISQILLILNGVNPLDQLYYLNLLVAHGDISLAQGYYIINKFIGI